MLSWEHISFADSFGVLLVGWSVVVERGLFLARHLSTLFYTVSWVDRDFLFPHAKHFYGSTAAPTSDYPTKVTLDDFNGKVLLIQEPLHTKAHSHTFQGSSFKV